MAKELAKNSGKYKKLLAVLLCIVLLSSFCAQLVSSDFGKVKVSALTIDARGGELDMDLYVPAGTSDSDKLPCVLLAHGRGATKNVVRGLAEELARRGYVVLNVNAYGMGMSEQPVSDDGGDGADHFTFGVSSYGMVDALNFARTLKYVDSTRLAMFGHSYGSSRASIAAATDSGYFTVNDLKINILADTFGLSFTEDEILQNADDIASAKLNADQLAYYKSLAEAAETKYKNSLSTLVLTGATSGPAPATVTVGGHEVQRECQVNITFVDGMYDSLGAGAMWTADGLQTILGEAKLIDYWYNSVDGGTTYEGIGALGETTTENSEALKTALANRTARIVCYNAESHSKNYFSSATNSDVAAILQEALDNRSSVAVQSNIWWLRAVLNCIAMMAMLASVVVLALILLQTPFFSTCIGKGAAPAKGISKGGDLCLAVITVVFTILALLKANSGGPVWANPFGTRWFPNLLRLVTTSAIAVWFVIWLAVASLVILVIKIILVRKAGEKTNFDSVGLGLGFGNVLKTLLLGLILIAFAYLQLIVIMYAFNQDFRFWQMMFSEMKAEHWLVALPYFILFLPCYLAIGCAMNYGIDGNLSAGKDMIKTIVINSLGVWVLCLFCYAMWFINWKGAAISDFTLSYSMLLFVPVTVYITRKMYKVTRSVWLGATINSLFLAWTLVCSAGIADKYYGQNIISVIFGA